MEVQPGLGIVLLTVGGSIPVALEPTVFREAPLVALMRQLTVFMRSEGAYDEHDLALQT